MKKMQTLVIGFLLVIGLLTGSGAMAQETATSDREFLEALVALFGGGGGPGGLLELMIRQDNGVQAINICGRAACLCTGSFCADLIAAGRCERFRCVSADSAALCLCEFP
jgi:hypothetical protein